MLDWVLAVWDGFTQHELWGLFWSYAPDIATLGGVIGFILLLYQFIWGNWRKRRQVRRDSDRLDNIQSLVQHLVATSPANSVPSATRLAQVTEAVESAVRDKQAGDERMGRALELLKAGKAEEAQLLFRAVAEEKTAHVAEDSRVAAAAWRHDGAIAGLADPKQARFAYAKAAELDPGNPDGRFWHGWLQKDAGNLGAAEAAFKAVVALGNQGASDRHRLWAHIGIGDVQVAQGNLPEALESYRASMFIARGLSESGPQNADWQRDLSVSHNKIGDVQVAQSNLPEALESYRASMFIRVGLSESDPQNADWQRDLSVSHDNIGDVQVAQGNLPEALESYRASMFIARGLSESGPQNADWQRDLSVSHNKIGDVQVAQSNLPEALESYRASMFIRVGLSESDPQNADWQRDLSVSHDNIGDVQVAQGNLPEALESYRASMVIRVGLSESDPQNAGWQADLAASHGKLGQLLNQMGERDKAREMLEQGRAIIAPLAERSETLLWKEYLRGFDEGIANLRE